MKSALRRAAAGKPATFPPRVLYHLVAARYGTTPTRVREDWPVDDFMDALSFLEVTNAK